MNCRTIPLAIFSSMMFACGDSGGNGPDPTPDPPKEIVYLGLKQELGWTAAFTSVWDRHGTKYRPSIQSDGGYLYVTSADGIYRKSLETLDDTKWERYGFEGVPVRKFVMDGDRLLATTSIRDGQAFLLSDDGGRTYAPHTPESLVAEADKWQDDIICMGIGGDPSSLLSIIHPLGVYSSHDFGKTWTKIQDLIGGFQEWFIGRHPSDSRIIYYTGETSLFQGFVYASFDAGETWDEVVAIENNCIHHIAFHRSLPGVVYYGGEGIIGKSTDHGRTWKQTLVDGFYVRKIIPHPEKAGTLFAIGLQRNGDETSMEIYSSTDGGESWGLFHSRKCEVSGGVLDAMIHGDKLLMYSQEDGVLMLDIG